MEILEGVLLVVHIAALLAVVYGLFVQLSADTKRINAAITWGATVQFVAGLALVGVLEAGDEDVDHAKIAVKLVVSLAVVGLAHANRRKPSIAQGVFWAILGLELVNLLVALLWG